MLQPANAAMAILGDAPANPIARREGFGERGAKQHVVGSRERPENPRSLPLEAEIAVDVILD